MTERLSTEALHEVNLMERFLKQRNLYYPKHVDFETCTICGQRRLIYRCDILWMETRCFDCDTKKRVDEEMANGTCEDKRTKFYFSEGRYMNVRDLFNLAVSQKTPHVEELK